MNLNPHILTLVSIIGYIIFSIFLEHDVGTCTRDIGTIVPKRSINIWGGKESFGEGKSPVKRTRFRFDETSPHNRFTSSCTRGFSSEKIWRVTTSEMLRRNGSMLSCFAPPRRRSLFCGAGSYREISRQFVVRIDCAK